MTTANTIPASDIVRVTPGVLAAGGTELTLSGLFLTTSVRVPIGTVASFASAADVGTFFGLSSDEYAKAVIYFAGFDNSNVKPTAMLFAQYNDDDVAAYLLGGSVAAAGLAALQAIASGTILIAVDGYVHTSAAINLTGAASFSAAAATINTALNNTEPTEASVTAALGAAFTASGSGTTLTVSAVASGSLHVGDTITGTGIPADTTITALGSGTGGTGTYTTSVATTASTASCVATSNVLVVSAVGSGTVAEGQTLTGSGVTTAVITDAGTGTGGAGTYIISGDPQHVASESMTLSATAPVVSYDSVSGGFVIQSGIVGDPSTVAFATGSLATILKLTSATGAVLSQGADATDPATFMAGVVAINRDWATFTTLFDPDDGDGNDVKYAFAEWNGTAGDLYAYVAWDTDESPTVTVPATESLGYRVAAAGISGACVVFAPDADIAAFVCGAVASINFSQTNGRTTLKFRGQSGIDPSVTSQTVANNLIANGYNFYGAWATAADRFQFFSPGSVSGRFQWMDSYVDQIWMNANFQLDGMILLTNVNSIPYNAQGYSMIEAAFTGTINDALNAGVIRAGVSLSALQKSEVNAAAGVPIDATLSQRGWYLQIKDASPTVRAARGSPPSTFWYMDGQSVQKIDLASIELQ